MKKRASYQSGSVLLKTRKRGPDVWVLRYTDPDGSQPSVRIGTVVKYPTKAAAQKRAAKLLEEINERVCCIRVSGLCDRYAQDVMPNLRADTAASYASYLGRVREHFGDRRLDAVVKDIMGIETWINDLETTPTLDRKSARGQFIAGRPARPLSKKTKLHMKAFIHRLFECAIKWGLISMQRNPIQLLEVEGRARRSRRPNLLTTAQWIDLIADSDLCDHVRTMIFVAMLLGLRASEILGLRWEDIDFNRMVLSIRRSHVGKEVGETKTEDSEQELPIHEDLAEVLHAWREKSIPVNGWLFGNIITSRPFWRDSLQTDHLVPAGRKVGIKNLGWHDFRHTYRAMMRELDLSPEQQKNLMRHSDIRTTLDYGGKTPAEQVRPGNERVVEMLRKRA